MSNFTYSNIIMFEHFLYFVREQKYIRITWNSGWDILNGCADPATPATGPVDSQLALGLWGCVSLLQEIKKQVLVRLSIQQ